MNDSERYRYEIKTNPTLQRMFFNTQTGDLFEDKKIEAKAYWDDFKKNVALSKEEMQHDIDKYGSVGAGVLDIGKGLVNAVGSIATDLAGPLINDAFIRPVSNGVRRLLGKKPKDYEYSQDEQIRKYIATTDDEETLNKLKKVDIDNVTPEQRAALHERVQNVLKDK